MEKDFLKLHIIAQNIINQSKILKNYKWKIMVETIFTCIWILKISFVVHNTHNLYVI